VILCGLVAAALYLPTLKYQLVWDDVDLIVQNRSSPFAAFGHDFWHGRASEFLGKDPYYRPLANLSFGIDEVIAGHRAWYFHLVNLLLHAVFVMLAAVVLWRAFGRAGPTVVCGLLLAVHPMFADSVAYVSGRTDVLCGIGLLAALLGLMRLRQRPDMRSVLLMWAGYAVALFSKETGALFILAAFVFAFAVRRRGRVERPIWVGLAGLVVLLAGYLLLRVIVLGSVLGMRGPGNPVAQLFLALNGLGLALVRFVVPFSSSVFSWDAGLMSRPTFWLIPAVAFLVLPFLVKALRRSWLAEFGWLWAWLFLLPVVALSGFGPSGRLLYIPGIGVVLVLGLLIQEWTKTKSQIQRASFAVGLVWCAVLLPFTLSRMTVWHDGFTLFSRMTREAPGYAAGHFNMAFELRQRSQLDAAVTEYRTTIALDSTAALAYSNLGAVLQSQGKLDEAEKLYRKTIELQPEYPLAWNNLAIVLYKRGDGSGAISALRKAIQLKPDDAGAVYNLGRIYQQANMPDSARACFKRAYQLSPADSRIRASYDQTHGVKP
jgi:tetratricopeptide (TPR) repeat protein